MGTYADSTVRNSFFVIRLAHSRRFGKAIGLAELRDGQRVLDYGTGDGHLLRCLLSRGMNLEIFGYEPFAKMLAELSRTMGRDLSDGKVCVANSLDGMPEGSFDRIFCLEVLEHLPPAQLASAVRDMTRLLADDGRIIVSVPIEAGLSSLVKNVIRLIAGRAFEDTGLKTLMRSLLCLRVERMMRNDYYDSHIGFSRRDLEKEFLSLGLRIRRRAYSPLPITAGFLNSQAFYVLATVG